MNTKNHSNSHSSSDHGSNHGHDHSQQKGSIFGIAIMAVLVLIFFIVVKAFFIPNDKNKEEDEKVSYIFVTYGPNYKDPVFLDPGYKIRFKESTTPYCVLNGENKEECGEKGENVAPKLGNTIANTKLYFKSSNGQKGKLKILLITD